MRTILGLAVAAILAGCVSPPREAALAGRDLGDPGTIAQLSRGLSPKERAAFATYALLHWPDSKAYCGRPDFSRARSPLTVGQAIDETVAFDLALEEKRRAENAPKTFYERKAAAERRLVDAFDQLTMDRDILASRDMPQDDKDRALTAIEHEMEENRVARRLLAAQQPGDLQSH